MNWAENDIETFIIEHKDQFSKCDPSTYHNEHFLFKLQKKFKHLISIIPYLVRLVLVWFIVAGISVAVWNNYIRKDRHEITLKEKIVNIVTFKK
jgi:hypothetical protein